jgi:hypothetical protein
MIVSQDEISVLISVKLRVNLPENYEDCIDMTKMEHVTIHNINIALHEFYSNDSFVSVISCKEAQ